ncbi:hypothetical protein ACFXAM_12185, partial [Kitasatospora sp. NPDC059462]
MAVAATGRAAEGRAPPPDSSASGALPSTPPSSPEPPEPLGAPPWPPVPALGAGFDAGPLPDGGAGVARCEGAVPDGAGADDPGAAGAPEAGAPVSGRADGFALPRGVAVALGVAGVGPPDGGAVVAG